MARTVKPDEFASKRGAILDVAQRLVLTRGYEQFSIQDIRDELQISSGAFHHYFDSRAALLDALIERIQAESGKPLLSIAHDPHLSAIDKLRGFFATLDQLRIAHKSDVVAMGRVWYADGNAVVRQKVDEAIMRQRAPLLVEIVRQGIQEGVFTTDYPEQAGEIIMALLQGMGNTHARLFLSLEQTDDEAGWIEQVVATHAAYLEAIERVLGAPPNALDRTDADTLKVWMAALRDTQE